jgi:hypothetical protein
VEKAAQLLEVSEDADEDDVQEAYQDAVLETHPDTGGDPDIFIAVDRARDILAGEREAQTGPAKDEAGPSGTETASSGRENQNEWRRAAGFNKEAGEKVLNAVTGMLNQHTTEEALKDKYGPNATIENVAEIIAAMIVNGAIDLGDISKMLNEDIRFGPNMGSATGGIFGGGHGGSGLFDGGSGGAFSNDPEDYMSYGAGGSEDEEDEDEEDFGGF